MPSCSEAADGRRHQLRGSAMSDQARCRLIRSSMTLFANAAPEEPAFALALEGLRAGVFPAHRPLVYCPREAEER